ncbi:MAG: methylcobamide--CoM methyltransferase [Synergistaceae bacterium]|jgi:[methyl-Co(III) methanol-specific corrinoid protein]:coenzyme M methyltransferase|nr:methylcobamide--CoM methyltransferase [Synergistaceae bacterium]
MDIISPKERLLNVLSGKPADRPTVICPGGMMNAAVVDVMKNGAHTLPAAHHDAGLMSGLADDVQRETGFENFGIPFCMTVEAESLGSSVDYGTIKCEPKIGKESFPSVRDVEFRPKRAIEKNKRARAIVDAISTLSQKYPDIPTIGAITGPLSTSASIVDPMTFLKELRRGKNDAHRVLDYVCNQLIDYAGLMIEGGADVISIADPTATGEILGPLMFGEYAVPYLNQLADAIHKLGIPVIIHICGNVKTVRKGLAMLHGDALSVDAMVSLGTLKSEISGLTTMGNLSTYMLEFGDEEKVRSGVRSLLGQNIDIMAPACGLSTSTPIRNIRAFTLAVKEGL